LLPACTRSLSPRRLVLVSWRTAQRAPVSKEKNNNNEQRQTQTAKPISKNKKSNQKTQHKHRQRQTDQTQTQKAEATGGRISKNRQSFVLLRREKLKN
jgi:hypothetical protein